MRHHHAIMVATDARRPRIRAETRRDDKVLGVTGILSWWDSFELWLTGRGFVLQTLIVMPVVLALAHGFAVAIDAVLGGGIRLLGRLRGVRR